MPSWAREEAEAVAGGFGGADAPARCRCARFQILRRPQQKEREARCRGDELQPLAQFQIELVDRAGHGLRRTRMQRFLQCPQGFFPMRRLDQDQAARIETQGVEAVAMRAAIVAQPVGRHDEDDRVSPRQARKERHDEAEGGGSSAFFGYDFVQGAAGQTALRQVRIEGGKAEGQGCG
jgi:hypothetical protein